MDIYDMVQRVLLTRSLDDRDLLPYPRRRPSSYFDDDMHDRQKHRRRSSLTGYDLNYSKDKSLPKSSTMLTSQMSTSKLAPSTTDQIRLPYQLQRRSTIHRLNSSTNNETNVTRIQSNEYTSITDG